MSEKNISINITESRVEAIAVDGSKIAIINSNSRSGQSPDLDSRGQSAGQNENIEKYQVHCDKIPDFISLIIDSLSEQRDLEQGSFDYREHTLMIDEAVRSVRRVFEPQAGSIVAGACLEKVIGTGNFGTVWEAYDRTLCQKVAVKVFRLERLAEGQMLSRFRRSIRAMQILSEARRKSSYSDDYGHIVNFIRPDPTGLAFAMDLIEGGDLSKVRTLRWSLTQKIEATIDLCSAVKYSHQNGVIHRDIKPANVVIDNRGNPVLTDFDISDIKYATTLSTTVEGGLGTPIFAAPEQLVDAELASEKSDVYGLGRLLHFLLLETSPGYAQFEHPRLSSLKKFPPGLVEVVWRATETNPSGRFLSAEEMRHALRKCMERRASWSATAKFAARAVGRKWPAITVVAFCIITLSAGLIYRTQKTEERMLAEVKQKQHDRDLKVMSDSRLVDGLASEALISASKSEWVYPRGDHSSPTALQKIVELENLQEVEGSITRSVRLRSDFSIELNKLGDRYWSTPEGKGFSKQYYTMAWMFDPMIPEVASRSGKTADELETLRSRAIRGEFTEEELEVAKWLDFLAEDNEEIALEKAKKILNDKSAGGDSEEQTDHALAGRALRIASHSTTATGKKSIAKKTPTVNELMALYGSLYTHPQQPMPEIQKPEVEVRLGANRRIPEKAAALADEGMQALRKGNRDEAKNLFNQAISYDSINAKALMGLSDVFFDTGSYQKAVLYAEKAVKAASKDSRYRIKLGDAYYAVLRYRDALDEYKKAKSYGSSGAQGRINKVEAKLGG